METTEETATLASLADELRRPDWRVRLEGGVLAVTNPATPCLNDRISCDGVQFRWAWGQAIGSVTDVQAAADRITYALRGPAVTRRPFQTGAGSVTRARVTRQQEDICDCPDVRTGAKIAVQWVRTSASGGEDQDQPEEPVTGEPPASVTLPELPASGRVPLRLVEEHLAALITGGGSNEIRAVERKSVRADPGPRPCGLTVHMHSGADVFGVFVHMTPAGASFSGGEFEQREEV
ncbi:hypothetical protein [Actinomadura formosensis]|uniref:hypothetical protein n=1 Tax=Actinomadura formosensis TaxID=60706 RepID=UPI003D8F351B